MRHSTVHLLEQIRVALGMGPMLGFGGTTVDGVERPVWPALLESPARH
jgi:hypothetical protein